MMERYLRWVLGHRAVVLSVIGALCLAAIGVLSQATIGSSLVKLFFGKSEKYARYSARMDEFGASDVMVIVYDDDALFTVEGFARLGRLTEALEALPDVRRVDSLASAPRMRSEDDELIVESYGSVVAGSSSAAAALREELARDELVGGLMLSRDQKATAVIVEFTNDPGRPAESLPALIDSLLAPFAAEGLPREAVHIAGLLPESSEATNVARQTMERTFPLTALVLILVVWVLFRRLWPVTITLGVALISVLWSMAFAVLLDRQISLLLASVPAVTMVICFSDIIHLCSAYLLELGAGHPKEEAILKSGGEVGVACFFTSLTTFVGFLSMVFVPTPAFQQLGAVLGFGVAVALLLALTLVPLFFQFMPAPDARGTLGARSGLVVERVAQASLRLATVAPRVTVAAFAVAAGVSAWGISRIEVETNFLNRLDPANRLRLDREAIVSRFAGTNVIDLYVGVPEPDGMLEPARLQAVRRLQETLEAQPEIDQAGSIVDVMARLGETLGTAPLPDSAAGAAQYLLLFEMAGGEGVDRMIDAQRRTLRLSLRLSDNGFVGTAAVGDRAVELARAALGPDVEIEATGLSYLFGDWIENIIDGQRTGLLFAILATTLMMIWCLGQLGPGLWSMIPNLLPLAALGGYVGFAWDAVDSDTLLVAMIAIGIGVDDTIHFLTRLRRELARTEDVQEALERSFQFTGRAIIQTTLILGIGFAPFLTSTYFSTRILGTLLPMTLFVALIADLLLVPALVKLGLLRFRRPAAS